MPFHQNHDEFYASASSNGEGANLERGMLKTRAIPTNASATRIPQLLVLLALLAVGCGPSEDPAAFDRLKKANAILMKSEGKTYQVIPNQKITNEIAEDIAKLGHLKNLNFKGSELTDDTFTTAVSGLNPISVVLDDTAITDAGIPAMKGYSRIEAIFLKNAAITDESLKTIGRLKSLAELNLDGTKITSEGLASLTGLSNLKRLVLNNTALDDAGLEKLAPMSNLGKVDVANTSVTADGIRALQKAIPGLDVAK